MEKYPLEADVLIAYATTPGYVSWRNSCKGSWFIQSLCEVFAKFAHRDDVLSMLTKVKTDPITFSICQVFIWKYMGKIDKIYVNSVQILHPSV